MMRLRYRRIGIPLLVSLILLPLMLLLLVTYRNCWPNFAVFDLFEHRRHAIERTPSSSWSSSNSSCSIFSTFSSISSFFVDSHEDDEDSQDLDHLDASSSTLSSSFSSLASPSSSSSSSLLVRPLKYWPSSQAASQLTPAYVRSLLNRLNQTHTCDVTNRFRNESQAQRLSLLADTCRRLHFAGRMFTYRASLTNQPINEIADEEDPESDDNNKTAARSSFSSSSSRISFCSTKTCPYLIDERARVATCFVQKIASTSVKQIYLRLTDSRDNSTGFFVHNNLSAIENLTEFHLEANARLRRVSPTFLRYSSPPRRSSSSKYRKSIFVRHPFVRLVSAFKDKAECSPDREPYFFAQYWYPLLDRLDAEASSNLGASADPNRTGSSSSANRSVTFAQFVTGLLLRTDPYDYDEHWAPIWTRCEPCMLRFDFIGKLESGGKDFAALRRQIAETMNNESSSAEEIVWANRNSNFAKSNNENEKLDPNDLRTSSPANRSVVHRCEDAVRDKYAETARYIAQLEPADIIELYKRYYLDFELFGYSLSEIFV